MLDTKRPEWAGKIKVALPKYGMGTLQVWVWDDNGLQYGSASGCGYDKLSAALHGINFDGYVIQDSGIEFTSQLRDAGYLVVRAI